MKILSLSPASMEYMKLVEGGPYMIELSDGQRIEIGEDIDRKGNHFLSVRIPGTAVIVYPDASNRIRIQATEE